MKHNNGKWIRVMCTVLAVAIVVYLFHDVFKANFKKYETQTATEIVEQEKLTAQAFILRDEQYIEGNNSGTVVPLVSDGMRVASGDSVARVCKSEQEAAEYSLLIKSKEELERYQKLSKQTELNSLDMEKLNNEINERYRDLLVTLNSGSYTDFEDNVTEVEDRLASKQILSDGSIDLDGKFNELQTQISSLEAKNIQTSDVSAPSSGYYISNIDGYEQTLDYKDIEYMTPSKVEEALKAEPSQVSGKMGKIVTSYMWYLCMVVDSKNSVKIGDLDTVKINIPFYGYKDVETKVVHISGEKDGKVAVVLSCDMMNESYANMRNVEVELIINEYRGYKVDSSAIRQIKDKHGDTVDVVYILRGNIMNARRINILYDAGDYFIDEIDKDNTGPYKPVKLYDEIIVKGRNLEDGKIID